MGKDCAVTEPLYNTQFKFDLLRKNSNYKVPAGNFIFDLNVCGPITGGQDTCQGVGACQKTPDSNYSMGRHIYT